MHPKVSQLFREKKDFLSLMVHGNNHLGGEMSLPLSWEETKKQLAQSIVRIARMEGRYGIHVSRVMVPPHQRCSEQTARVMTLIGYEGVCITKSYPWLEHPPADRPLAGWELAEMVCDGLPVLLRYPLTSPKDRWVLGAFLRQPIILYGHHQDAKDGLDIISEAAGFINSFGSVRWCSLEDIVRSNYMVKHEGKRQKVRMYSRKINLNVSEVVEEIVIEIPSYDKDAPAQTVRCGDNQSILEYSLDQRGWISNPVALNGIEKIDVDLVHPDSIDVNDIPKAGWSPKAVIRRCVTEARDRILPLLYK